MLDYKGTYYLYHMGNRGSGYWNRTPDMPKLYMEDGKPKALIIAVLPKDSEVSFATIIPIHH